MHITNDWSDFDSSHLDTTDKHLKKNNVAKQKSELGRAMLK